jgi:hypothetical protein
MLGSAVTRSGIATAAADGDVFPAGVRSGRAGAVVRGVDPDSPRRAPVSVAGRFHRVRVVGPAESARDDEAASLPVSEGSAGVAQAYPAPPETTAAPIPSATARPIFDNVVGFFAKGSEQVFEIVVTNILYPKVVHA